MLTSSIDSTAYDLGTSHTDASFPAILGCDQLSFDPSLTAKPTTTEADSPSGLDVDLTVPQQLSPNTLTASAIRDVTVTLPEGFTINSNAADGKTSCTDVQAHFGTRLPAECPEFSKIGTMEVEASAFPRTLTGAMYLGEPLPGNRYRIFQVFDGFSLHSKLAGVATPDPVTGQVAVTFKDLPQFNFQDFKMHIFGAERGLLSTPSQCGTYPVVSEFTPWAYPQLPKQTSTQFFTIDSGPNGSPCPPNPRPFGPSFDAGVTDNTAGQHSSFLVDLNRADGDQFLTGLDVRTPPGFSATLKGIPYCPEATITALQSSIYTGLQELASPACPADSEVGDVIAGAGSGSKPLHVPGKVYWAGPYKGAPLSLLIVIPAVSGPYDLGNVAVRVALYVDPVTARVSAVSDPLPQIIEGIPLRTREIRVDLDRKGFILNPTNCDPFSVDATAHGDQGASAELSNHFQVANCASLDFSPELSLKLKGATKRTGHPKLRAVLKTKDGEANLSSASVAMPHSLFLDNAHLRNICTRDDYAAHKCKKASIYGHAAAFTPILDKPLRGPVYLRSSGKALPDLVLDLRGQVNFEASAHIDSVNQGIRTTFDFIPDIPISKVVLNMQGGAKGLLQISRDNFCANTGRAIVRIGGQNGKRAAFRQKLDTSCAKKRSHKRHRRARVLRARKAA
ncbi:MAG TPA: hypothetical protein VF176_05000 [Solirubrobacterales bacterium]